MSVSRLEALQRRFIRSVVERTDPELAAATAGGGSLTAEQSVQVYRDGYPARLTEALGETYEMCWRVLGDEGFFAAARAYIARTPSRSHNLSDYGAYFPEFLESWPGARQAPYLGDLARLSWAFKELFHAKPDPGLGPEILARKTRPESVLRFGSALRRLALGHRVHAVFRRDRADDAPIDPASCEGPERLLLYKRDGNTIQIREMSAAEDAALTALASGRRLADALDAAEGLDAAGAQELFVFLSSAGLVTGVE